MTQNYNGCLEAPLQRKRQLGVLVKRKGGQVVEKMDFATTSSSGTGAVIRKEENLEEVEVRPFDGSS